MNYQNANITETVELTLDNKWIPEKHGWIASIFSIPNIEIVSYVGDNRPLEGKLFGIEKGVLVWKESKIGHPSKLIILVKIPINLAKELITKKQLKKEIKESKRTTEKLVSVLSVITGLLVAATAFLGYLAASSSPSNEEVCKILKDREKLHRVDASKEDDPKNRVVYQVLLKEIQKLQNSLSCN